MANRKRANGETATQNRTTQEAEYLAFDEAMRFLGVSKPTLYRLLKQGDVTGLKVGKQWRFRKSDLLAHMERKPAPLALAARPELEGAIALLEQKLGRTVAVPADVEPREAAQVTALVNAIFSIALESGASDVHIEPKARELLIRQRLDGVLHEVALLPASLHAPIVERLKHMGDLDISEKRMPQDGRMALTYQDRRIDVRVASMPSAFGEAVLLRLLDQSNVLVGFDRLGFHETDAAKVKQWLGSSNGLVLVTGPTGSGKTTVLYSLLQEVAGPERKTVSIEDPVEYTLPHTTQTHVNMRVNLTIPIALRALLRQDPDVIMIGEVRDLDTAQLASQAALTGHLVLSSMHTNSAAETLTRLLDLGVEPFLINAALRGTTAQRLVRCVCQDCRQAYKVEPALLVQVRKEAAAGGYPIPPKAQFWRGVGCAKCRQTGYRRRIGIYEVLGCSENLTQAVSQRASTQQLHEIAVRDGMTSLFADGIRKAVEGVTTIDEVLRVCGRR